MSPPDLDAIAIIETLVRHHVKFVVIGAFAAIAQQAPTDPTQDIDIAPERSPSNLGRLSAALKELDARIRTEGVPGGLAFDHDARSLAVADFWNLTCAYGDFDVCFHPAGFDGGYADLKPRARRMRVDVIEVDVADLADVIRSKELAGRPKDLRVLPALYRFLQSRSE